MYTVMITDSEMKALKARDNLLSCVDDDTRARLHEMEIDIAEYRLDQAYSFCKKMLALNDAIKDDVQTYIIRDNDDVLEDCDYNDDDVKACLKSMINSIYGASAAKTVHPDEDCVLPGCDRYGGNDTYLRIRKVLGHKGAFDFCMGNVIKLVDRWEKKGDPAQNLEKLRDYSAQALVEWRLWNEKLS